MKTRDIGTLKEMAMTLRHDVIDMVGYEHKKVGHIGGSCSLADIMAALYFYKMNHCAEDPNRPDRDYCILSKGHAALIQYAALAESGYFPREDILKVKYLNSHLQGHPDRRRTKGIEVNTGSLGQGLSQGLGIAMGLAMDGRPGRVYVVMGDGEQAEGQIWEAAIAASAYKTGNLIGILDNNQLQCTGPIAERLPQTDFAKRWESFGWEVISFDGHDMVQICDALDKADEIKNKPVLLLARTVKGKGISFAEGRPEYHNKELTYELFLQAHEDIDQMEGKSHDE